MGKKVVDHAKTQAGTRNVPYTDTAKEIIALIKKIYRYADLLNIPKKSAHKIRKTYISTIIPDGIDLDTVCKVSGHVDLKFLSCCSFLYYV